nr:MAG TPA: tRNA nucleotidyltransferase, second domain [Inoviridae sp.]
MRFLKYIKKHAECYPACFLITSYLVTLSLLYY